MMWALNKINMQQGTGGDTFCCKDGEVNERQLDRTYQTGIEDFYEQMLYVLLENRKVHERSVKRGKEVELNSGAVFALEDAIRNLEAIKTYFLAEKTK